MAFTENLDDFINPDTPGFVVASILGADVNGIFVNDFVIANIGMAGFESALPQLHCKAADLMNVVHETPVVIGLLNFRVADIEPDGTGITVLQLKK